MEGRDCLAFRRSGAWPRPHLLALKLWEGLVNLHLKRVPQVILTPWSWIGMVPKGPRKVEEPSVGVKKKQFSSHFSKFFWLSR